MLDSRSMVRKTGIFLEILLKHPLRKSRYAKRTIPALIVLLMLPVTHGTIADQSATTRSDTLYRIADSRPPPSRILELRPGSPSIVSIGGTERPSPTTDDDAGLTDGETTPSYNSSLKPAIGFGKRVNAIYKNWGVEMGPGHLSNPDLPQSFATPLNEEPR